MGHSVSQITQTSLRNFGHLLLRNTQPQLAQTRGISRAVAALRSCRELIGRSFAPDDWQQDVITAISENRSLLIVAPTSSGKSFASYEVVKHVVRYSLQHEVSPHVKCKSDPPKKKVGGVQQTTIKARVVYVLPTKALARQVYADLYNRYRSVTTTIGIFLVEERTAIETCQVLVTTPAMFDVPLGILSLPSSAELL